MEYSFQNELVLLESFDDQPSDRVWGKWEDVESVVYALVVPFELRVEVLNIHEFIFRLVGVVGQTVCLLFSLVMVGQFDQAVDSLSIEKALWRQLFSQKIDQNKVVSRQNHAGFFACLSMEY